MLYCELVACRASRLNRWIQERTESNKNVRLPNEGDFDGKSVRGTGIPVRFARTLDAEANIDHKCVSSWDLEPKSGIGYDFVLPDPSDPVEEW